MAIWLCQAFEHEADHGEAEERGDAGRIALEIARKPMVSADPREGPFDDPSLRQGLVECLSGSVRAVVLATRPQLLKLGQAFYFATQAFPAPARRCGSPKSQYRVENEPRHARGLLYGAGELASAVAVAEDRMGQLSQANYPAALKTPLGDDFLVLTSFSGNEVLGQPFERYEYPCWSTCVA